MSLCHSFSPSLSEAKDLISSSGDRFLDCSSLHGAYQQSKKDVDALLDGEALCERIALQIVDGVLREIADKGPIWEEAHSKHVRARLQAKRERLERKAQLEGESF